MGSRSLKASSAGIEKAKQALQYKGLTQKALAEELGISRSTIGNFFNGKSVDRSIFIDEICHKLNLDWQEIFAKPPRSPEEESQQSKAPQREGESSSFTYEPGTPFQAPPLPSYYLERPQITKIIKKRLLANSGDYSGTLVISAIQGLGGIGKTTLAQALAHDRQIQERFGDGILWVTLGQQPDLLFLLQNWIAALKDYNYKPTTIQAASTHLNSLLYNKAILLIIDDVWHLEDIEPFQVGGQRCQVIITTRRADIASEVGAQSYSLNLMSETQSLKLLSKRLGRDLEVGEIETAKKLAKKVGYLPIALNLAAARIASGKSWGELAAALSAEIARLEVLEGIRRRSKKETRLEASFNLSLNFLRSDFPEAWESFIWLGVLPEDVSITAKMTATLWQIEVSEAKDRLELFWNDALLISGLPVKIDRSEWQTYRLHDLLHDLARRWLTEKQSPGLGLDLKQAHSILLGRYQENLDGKLWQNLADDGYIHDRLTWHLQKAGSQEQIHQLLAEETAKGGKNGWYRACDRLGKTAIFIADLNRAWQLAESEYHTNRARALGRQCRYALITASLNTIAGNIPPELIAVLIEKKFWSTAQGLAYSRQIQNLLQRVRVFAKLIVYLPEIGSEAIAVARAIADGSEKASAIVSLAPHLPQDLLFKAIAAANEIENKSDRARAIAALERYFPEINSNQLPEKTQTAQTNTKIAPQLSPEFLAAALVAASKIVDESERAKAISSLAPHLPAELLCEAIDIARQIADRSYRAVALISLAPQLPELYSQALQAAAQITSEFYRTGIISTLAPHLPQDLLCEAIDIASKIDDEFYRVRTIVALVKYFPEALVTQALETVFNLDNEADRVSALIALAPHLPPELLAQALQLSDRLGDEFYRVKAFSTLAPYLSPELLAQALQLSDRLEEFYRIAAITSLLPYLPAELLSEAIETVFNLARVSKRARAIVALGPYLPAELLSAALSILFQLENQSERASAITSLAPYLPAELIAEALRILLNLSNEAEIARAIVALGPYLPAQLLSAVLNVLFQLENEAEKARAISSIASYLPPELIAEVLSILLNLENEAEIARAISSIAPCLPEPLLSLAFEKLVKLRDEVETANALVAVAPCLPEPLLSLAFEELVKLRDEVERANALVAVAPCLPEPLLSLAFEELVKLRDEVERANALVAVAPHLPEPLLSQAVNILFALSNEAEKANALVAIAPYLPPELIVKALSILLNLSNEIERTRAISSIAPYLSEPLLSQAIAASIAINNEFYRANLISSVAPHLSPTLIADALEVARHLTNESYRAAVLSSYLEPVRKISEKFPYDFWCELIHSLASLPRKELLKEIGENAWIIKDLSGVETFKEITDAIQDVGRWFP